MRETQTPGLGRPHGQGKGYALQSPCLESSMDCILHGLAKSPTRWVTFTQAPSLWGANSRVSTNPSSLFLTYREMYSADYLTYLHTIYLFCCCFFFQFKFISNWRITGLKYCVGFSHLTTWISHRYTYAPSLLNLPSTSQPSGWSQSTRFELPGSDSKFPVAI